MAPQILGTTVGPIGYGLMGFTWRPQPTPIDDAVATMKAAFERGATLWNGAEFYGTQEHNSMTILKAYFTKYPEDADKVVLTIKGATKPDGPMPDGSPENIRRSANNIINQLGGTKKLDVFVIARRDRNSSFEGAIKILQEEYVDTGKIGGIGISECSAETLREAAKYTKVALAEVELSMFSPDILKNGVAAACAEHNIPIMGYAPLSRGILTGKVRSKSDVEHLGFIGSFPRYNGLEHNLKLVKQVEDVAAAKGVTSAQVAIAWVRSVAQRAGMPDVIPIPGATSLARVEENTKVVELSKDEIKALDELVDTFEIDGARYPEGVPTEL